MERRFFCSKNQVTISDGQTPYLILFPRKQNPMHEETNIATGPEHCDKDGRVCPYCRSENTDSGSLDTQAGQVVETSCECLDCGKSWGNLYNIAGWYDETEELHEDTRKIDEIEALKEKVRKLREGLIPLLDATAGLMFPDGDRIWHAAADARDATKEEL